MRRLPATLLLIPLLATPAWSPALELRRVGELRLGSGGLVEWLDPRGVLLMKKEWERTPSGGRRVTFVVADVRTQELLRLPFDLEAFARARPALFDSVPDVELEHFDGTTGLLRFDRREPSRTISHYVFWTPRTQALSEPVPIGEVLFRDGGGNDEVSRLTWFVGAEPAQGRLYFADVTYDELPRPEKGPLRIRFFRVTPPELKQDWELELVLPRRARQLKAETYRAFSPDGKRFAIAEYYDAEIDRKARAVPPPQVYVLDLERRKVGRYEIPRSPYGLAFSRTAATWRWAATRRR